MDVDGDTNVIKTSLHGQAEANIEIKSPTALSPLSGHTSTKKPGLLTTPITPSVPKERKRRVIIDDDDESPTFNPLRSTKKQRGKGRQKRQSLLLKKQQKAQLLSPSDKTNESALFTSPEGIVSNLSIPLMLLIANLISLASKECVKSLSAAPSLFWFLSDFVFMNE